MDFRTLAPTLFLATAAMAGSPVRFACRDAEGAVFAVHSDGKAWQKLKLNRDGLTGAPAAATAPSAFTAGGTRDDSFASRRWLLPEDHRDITYVGEKGDIHHLFHQGGKWAWETLNGAGATSAPPAAGPIAATACNRRQLTYTYADRDGNLQHIASLEGAWQAHRLNNGGRTAAPLAAGDPAVLERAPGRINVFYRDAAGGIQHLRSSGGTWKAGQLNLGGDTGAPAAAGDPVPLLDRERNLHIAYRDRQGNLQHLHRAQSRWTHTQLNNGGASNAPLAVGDPAGTVRPDGQLDYVYRDPEGGLQHLFRKADGWAVDKLDGVAASGPWIRAGGQEGKDLQVFYGDGQGLLQLLAGPDGYGSPDLGRLALPAGRLDFY